MPAPEGAGAVVVGVDDGVEVDGVEVAVGVADATVATGRFFVPTSTTASTGFVVTTDDTWVVETTAPSLRVRRSVMVRTPAAPEVATRVWSV